jgi:hypothetical protein
MVAFLNDAVLKESREGKGKKLKVGRPAKKKLSSRLVRYLNIILKSRSPPPPHTYSAL